MFCINNKCWVILLSGLIVASCATGKKESARTSHEVRAGVPTASAPAAAVSDQSDETRSIATNERVVSGQLLSTVMFPFGSDSLTPGALVALRENAAWLKKHSDAVIVLQGHCDEWGDSSYNLLLGDRRARNVKAALMDEGISSDRMIMVVSFGEEKPADPAHNRKAWRKNRRVEFVLR